LLSDVLVVLEPVTVLDTLLQPVVVCPVLVTE
jgi:hypothetical protein